MHVTLPQVHFQLFNVACWKGDKANNMHAPFRQYCPSLPLCTLTSVVHVKCPYFHEISPPLIVLMPILSLELNKINHPQTVSAQWVCVQYCSGCGSICSAWASSDAYWITRFMIIQSLNHEVQVDLLWLCTDFTFIHTEIEGVKIKLH